jgi:BMFP domain-containing protein YqiC
MTREPPPLPEALQLLADRLGDAVEALLPAGGAPDLRGRIDATVAAALGRLDLVPREEYERQVAALARLEAALARLESRLATLEAARAAPGDRT